MFAIPDTIAVNGIERKPMTCVYELSVVVRASFMS